MEFNWADPRKNKRVDSVMMAKAEASRVKRLTSVKSTVSNQLNPAVEHKLKTLKKKKTPDAADERPSSRLHQRDFELGHSSNNQLPHAAKSHRTSPSASQTHSFYNEFLPRAKSVFDSIDVHAAADGLFHPASNVQAFAEHDARYAPSHEKRLPPLSSERLVSRSESRLPTASSSSSSLTSYRSLGGKSGTGHRSDGDLHAPRRSGIVPSSADRDAMGLVEDELEDEPQASPPPRTKRSDVKPKRRTQDKGNNNHSDETPPLEGDLTQKFEQLKRMIQKNRHAESEKQQPEIEEDDDGATAATPSKHDTTKKNTKTRAGDTKHHRPVVASATSGSGQSVTLVRKPKNELLARHGVSLSELKHEHRAALAMLQELGGPLSEPGDKKKARCHVPRGSNETAPSQARPSGSADRASRLVEKLRAQIPSGRDKASPRRDEDVAVGGTATDLASAALDAARVVLESDTALKEEEEDDEDERLWRRYGGDEASQAQDDNDDDDPSEELYDDEYFEG